MSVSHTNGFTSANEALKARRKGSEPLISTARGKLQTRRSKVNDQINRELRMRNGAENLFRATGNKRLKELVAVELSFFNSNIQLLKEELSDLNSEVLVYQHDNCTHSVPMIPLGLKETTECDLAVPIKDFILEHYSEDGSQYEKEIRELCDLRQDMRTPQRNESGVDLLIEYFNQLHFIERRFFPPDQVLGAHFHWYDSLTGVPNTQKTMGFEKGSVLFNIGALYTQIGCKQDRTSHAGVQDAISNFQKAAGTFRYLHNHFTNAPSMDMQPHTLTMLIQLMMSQAQECVFECKVLNNSCEGLVGNVRAAQEAVVVSQMYEDTKLLMTAKPVKEYIPYSWVSMAMVKSEYYMALAHTHMAMAIIDSTEKDEDQSLSEFMEALQDTKEVDPENNRLSVPQTKEEKITLGKAHLKGALNCHEEALKLHDLCKQLRKIDTFLEILKKAHDRCLEKFSSLEEEDNFTEIIMFPNINPKTSHNVTPITPEFRNISVVDVFKRLGPITIFNAKNEWSAPRTITLDRNPDQGFGFSVRGDAPVRVAEMEPGSVAEVGKLKVGDLVVAVGDTDTKWAKHEEVVTLVRQCGNHLVLKLVTPSISTDQDTSRSGSSPGTPNTPLRMQSPRESVSTQSNKSNRSRLSAPWIFMRKGSKEKQDKPEKSKEMEDGEAFLH